MKLQLFLFFAFATPAVLFLATIAFGGTSPTDLKKSLAESGVYSQIASHFSDQDADSIANSNNFTILSSKRLTSSYIKILTESTIDESANWITGKTQTPPQVSFKEIKEELQSDYPDLLRVPVKSELQKTDTDAQTKARLLEQAEQLNAFIDADFTYPLGNKLEGIKLIYNTLPIILLVLISFLVCSIFLLSKLANSLPMKFRWIGAALLTSSLVGYIFIFFHPYFTTAITTLPVLQESEFISLFSPIITAIINYYFGIFVGYQKIVSTVLLAGAAGCMLGAIITGKQAVPNSKWVYNTRSFWEAPQKKEQLPLPQNQKKLTDL